MPAVLTLVDVVSSVW